MRIGYVASAITALGTAGVAAFLAKRKWDNERLFIKKVKLVPSSPLYSVAPTFEMDYPYRASISIVLRLLRSFGVVLGAWENHPDPDDDELVDRHFYHALRCADGSTPYYSLPDMRDLPDPEFTSWMHGS